MLVLITFSIMLRTNCDAKCFDVAFRLLEAMLQAGMHPDVVIYLYYGRCALESNVEVASRIYEDGSNSNITGGYVWACRNGNSRNSHSSIGIDIYSDKFMFEDLRGTCSNSSSSNSNQGRHACEQSY